MSLRFHFNFTSIPLRFHFDFTSISLRGHFEFNSIPLRFHFDSTSISLRFDFTSISLRGHFEFTSISLRFRVDFTSSSLRVHFDFASILDVVLEAWGIILQSLGKHCRFLGLHNRPWLYHWFRVDFQGAQAEAIWKREGNGSIPRGTKKQFLRHYSLNQQAFKQQLQDCRASRLQNHGKLRIHGLAHMPHSLVAPKGAGGYKKIIK